MSDDRDNEEQVWLVNEGHRVAPPEEQDRWEIHLRPRPEAFSLPSDEDEEGEK